MDKYKSQKMSINVQNCVWDIDNMKSLINGLEK